MHSNLRVKSFSNIFNSQKTKNEKTKEFIFDVIRLSKEIGQDNARFCLKKPMNKSVLNYLHKHHYSVKFVTKEYNEYEYVITNI